MVACTKYLVCGYELASGEQKKKTYDLALCAMIFLDHLHVWIFGKAVLTNGGKVCRLPAGSIQIMLDLRRHIGQYGSVERGESFQG